MCGPESEDGAKWCPWFDLVPWDVTCAENSLLSFPQPQPCCNDRTGCRWCLSCQETGNSSFSLITGTIDCCLFWSRNKGTSAYRNKVFPFILNYHMFIGVDTNESCSTTSCEHFAKLIRINSKTAQTGEKPSGLVQTSFAKNVHHGCSGQNWTFQEIDENDHATKESLVITLLCVGLDCLPAAQRRSFNRFLVLREMLFCYWRVFLVDTTFAYIQFPWLEPLMGPHLSTVLVGYVPCSESPKEKFITQFSYASCFLFHVCRNPKNQMNWNINSMPVENFVVF